jgi:hypothetical protein
MAILRPLVLPSSTSNSVVAPSRSRRRTMTDPEFYRRIEERQEEQEQARSKIVRPEFQQEPITGQFVQHGIEQMKGRTPAPTLNPGSRAVMPDTSKIQGAFKGYYDRLNTIGQISNEQLGTAQALAAARRLAALNSVGNTGAVSGGGGANQAKFTGSGDVGGWINQAAAILSQAGINLSDQDKAWVATIIQHESGGNPNIVNDWDSNAARGTPSKGLMQTIDPTFNSHKLPGYNDIYNPVHNIIAGVRYAISRYGSIGNVPGIVNLRRGNRYVGY